MQKCTSCGKTTASIHVIEVSGWEAKSDQWLCPACGEQEQNILGHSQAITPDVLSGLMGKVGKLGNVSRRRPLPGLQCPGCRMTSIDFRNTGRFGCPRCYETFREALLPVLHKVHDATTHCGRFPGPRTSRAPRPIDLDELRFRLEEAVRNEDYEEAARLRDRLQKATGSGETID